MIEQKREVQQMKQPVTYEEFHSFYYYSGSSQNWKMTGYHFHKEYELILFLCDGAELSIGDRVYKAEAGDLFLIHNQEYHKTEGADGVEYRRFVLMFDPEPVKQAEAVFRYPFTKYFEHRPAEFSHKLHLTEEPLAETIRLFENIENHCHEKDRKTGETAVQLGILELLLYVNQVYDFFLQDKRAGGEADGAELYRAKSDAAGTSGPGMAESASNGREPSLYDNQCFHGKDRILQIKNYVGEHVDEKLDLEQIADRFYLSRDYLSHYFKKETGFTLGQYITIRKMERAKTLLRQGFSVTETAVALSYHSDSHFINTFKRMTGTTPKKYAAVKKT